MCLTAMAVAVAIVGCHGSKSAGSVAATKQYPVRGLVESVDVAGQSIALKADAIPGFMEAMTMAYKVSDPAVVGELHAGDMISATLLADDSADGPTNFRLEHVVIIAQAKPDYKPAMQYHVPAEGDAVPNFKLLNQSARTISLKQFRGKVVLMTFIYTRCPLADFCPRMSHNFATINKDLATDAALYAKTHLLSVSFDPQYDTPKVLRSYGEAYTGLYTKSTFAHWEFAAPEPSELAQVQEFFDLGVTPGPRGTLQHSLSTIVIGKDGRVAAFYPTNDWTTAEVEADVRKAAAA